MTKVDLFALAFVALTALLGLKKGLIASALSVAGIVVGAFVGARLAPQLLTGGSNSPYTPLAGLAGAAFGALLFETLAAFVGGAARRAIPLPPLRMLDSIGGFVLGAASGLVLVWVVGASALLIPGQTNLRHAAQKSLVLQQLYAAVPPSSVMKILARVDPFPSIAGPLAPVAPPDPALLRSPAVRRAAPSVVRVLGTACGLRIAGSGWVAEPSLVVTAAHVVAGEDDTVVALNRSTRELPATVVAFDQKNDVALLRVPALRARPLPLRKPSSGKPSRSWVIRRTARSRWCRAGWARRASCSARTHTATGRSRERSPPFAGTFGTATPAGRPSTHPARCRHRVRGAARQQRRLRRSPATSFASSWPRRTAMPCRPGTAPR